MPTRPAAEAAGYGCEARLCGLEVAIPEYSLKNHQPPSALPGQTALVPVGRVSGLRNGSQRLKVPGVQDVGIPRTVPIRNEKGEARLKPGLSSRERGGPAKAGTIAKGKGRPG